MRALAELEKAGRIERVEIRDGETKWAGEWFIHSDAVPEIRRLDASRGDWEGRTTLLSPFDNLLADRKRTSQFFDFDFAIEIYVPKAKRKYGYYVLPILHGDRLIGRVDPAMDRENARLTVNAVYAEPWAETLNPRETGKAVAGAIEELATFLGAKEIVYAKKVPEKWKSSLR